MVARRLHAQYCVRIWYGVRCCRSLAAIPVVAGGRFGSMGVVQRPDGSLRAVLKLHLSQQSLYVDFNSSLSDPQVAGNRLI